MNPHAQRFVAAVFLLAVVAFVPAVAALVLLERLAQHLGLLDGDVLDTVVQRWRRARQPIDPDWERLPKLAGVRYRAYLESDAWKRKRRYVLYYAGHRCRVCNGGRRLEVHHRTYKRLGWERPDDLTVLCQDCHRLFPESLRPKARNPPSGTTTTGAVVRAGPEQDDDERRWSPGGPQ